MQSTPTHLVSPSTFQSITSKVREAQCRWPRAASFCEASFLQSYQVISRCLPAILRGRNPHNNTSTLTVLTKPLGVQIYKLVQIITLLSGSPSTPSCLRPCYYPDGSIADKDYPCNPHTEDGVCCGKNHACLNNKVCLKNVVRTVRGSCTVRDPDCPQFCQRKTTTLAC